MTKREEKVQPLEEGLITAMRALDNQVAREMQRTPEEREAHGVQKWEPINKRVENVAALVMNALGDEEVGLDSLLILSQAFAKSLQLVVEDLGEEGLGKMRAQYVKDALKNISDAGFRGTQVLGPSVGLN